ncbi:MAG: sigma-70 family RNA polymerase sigma factor [Chloroflexi bacterium]|nr:sigma-70 family RNA polymerase sigma factor [Chloroflexota bacterium]
MCDDLAARASTLFPSIGGTGAGALDADAPLVRQSRDGDRDAFAALVSRHQRSVFNLAFRLLGNYDDASDAAQETFLIAWRRLDSFREEARFSTWLYRIAYNVCLKRLELRRRDGSAGEADLAGEPAPTESAGTQAERRVLVAEGIATLPLKYRAVVVLFYLREHTYEEIAEILDLPVGTVKTHLFRARQLLKEALR